MGNLNPYIYTYQNPINLIDPNGKQTASRAHGRGYRGIGIPIPVYEKGNIVTPFPVHDVEFIQEGFDKLNNDVSRVFQGLIVKVSVFGIKGFDIVKDLASRVLNSDNLRPEKGYEGTGKHGINWKEGKAEAKKTGIPQGQWGSQEDLDYAGQKASSLKPREGAEFELPADTKSVVHMPDGNTKKATHMWVRNNGNGKTFHGYPKVK